jgi:ketosteroid isomerase-like protein
MSQENLETARRLYELAPRADWDEIKLLISSDVAIDQGRFPDGGVGHGREAFRGFFRRWFGTWDELNIEVDRFIDLGERVVVLMKLSGRGKLSGAPATLDAADVLTFENGTVTSLVGYLDQREALEAVGLSEKDAHADS